MLTDQFAAEIGQRSGESESEFGWDTVADSRFAAICRQRATVLKSRQLPQIDCLITGRNDSSENKCLWFGYVGCVSAACFAEEGNEVIGVDVNPTKVEIINDGKSPIVEEGINELIAKVVKAGPSAATTDSARAVNESDLSLVCVGTPSNQNGSLAPASRRTGLPRDRRGDEDKDTAAHRRHSQHDAAGHRPEHRRAGPRRDVGKESDNGFRHLHQSGVPA